MTWTTIANTPLQIDVRFDENGDGVLRSHPVVGNGQLTELVELVLPSAVAELQPLLTPLDQRLSTFWTSATVQNEVHSRIVANMQGGPVYGVEVSIPQEGMLRALTQPVTIAADLLPAPSAPSTQLTLSFQVPGFTGSLKVASEVASFLDAQYNFSFDGELRLFLAVPHDPRLLPGWTAILLISNVNTSQGSWQAWLWQGLSDIELVVLGSSYTGGSLTGAQPMQSQSLDATGQFAAIMSSLLALWPAFAQAFNYGFQQLTPQVGPALAGAVPGSTVELVLTHPVDGPPALRNASVDSAPSFLSPEIAALPAQAHPTDSIAVVGRDFPAPQSTSLTLAWTDTTTGGLVKAVISWGATTAANTPPSAMMAPVVIVPGQSPSTSHYTFTGLLSNTWYGFQIQEFDVPGFDVIATEPSPWTYAQTSATDQVAFVINGDPNPLTYATLQAGGTVATSIVVPDLSPGTHSLSAVLGGQTLAQTNIVVVDPAQPLPPSLQILDPASGLPYSGSVGIVPPVMLRLRGDGFNDGPVALYADGPTAVKPGTPDPNLLADALATGTPGSFTVDTLFPVAPFGAHVVLAKQGSDEATAGVYVQSPAQ